MLCLDLFSGCRGIATALQPYCRTAAYCDIAKECQEVIKARVADRCMEDAPIFADVQSVSYQSLAACGVKADHIVCISAGFPCQDISTAGRQMGVLGDTRSSLWREVLRLAQDLPSVEWLFLENVPAILTLKSKGIGPIIADIQQAGYCMRWTTLSCSQLGACHQRERWWALCHREPSDAEDARPTPPSDIHNTKPAGVHELLRRCDTHAQQGSTTWPPELPAFRVHHGIPSQLDTDNRRRCAIVGNSVSPPVARLAFETLLGLQYLSAPDAYDGKEQRALQTKADLAEATALEHEDMLPHGWYVEADAHNRLNYWSPSGRRFRGLAAAQAYVQRCSNGKNSAC